MAFLAVSWGEAAGVLLCERIFLHVMVGGGRGVAGPKELMGLVGTVTRQGLLSSHTTFRRG